MELASLLAGWLVGWLVGGLVGWLVYMVSNTYEEYCLQCVDTNTLQTDTAVSTVLPAVT
jgi:hypothetical protein